MSYQNYIPKTLSIQGSDLTGTDGTANRTYTISDSGVLSDGMQLSINGTLLHEGASYDFTVSGSVITFLNIVDNSDIIQIIYFVGYSIPSFSSNTNLKYASPLMLVEILGLKTDVPTWESGSSPVLETVGTGNGSTTIFYLDHKNVLSDSYIFSYGASASATTQLTETTHYTIDKDNGKITLTSTGKTLISTNNIYASYSYISNGMSDSYLVDVLSRAEAQVDGIVNSTFTDGTEDNPSYPVTIEIQASEGFYQDRIIVNKKPMIDITSTLSADISAVVASIALASGDGDKFSTSGYIIIGSEVISYTGITTDTLTGCTRGALGTTAATHSSGDDVHTTILFRSDTEEGTAVSWTVQAWNTDMYASEDGLVYKFGDASPDFVSGLGVANRIKIIYYYGHDTIPEDIKRLTLLFAKRMLIRDNVGKAMIMGRDEFRPEMYNIDQDEINLITGKYIVLPMGNT